MYGSSRSALLLAAPILVAVAIIGYLAGHHGTTTSSGTPWGGQARVASTANMLLEYPSSWHRVQAAPAVPGLTFTHQIALAPAGDPAKAGLIAGELPPGEPSPLPRAFLSLLHGAPHTEVVDFLGGQAFGYSRMSIPGYDSLLELFVIPGRGAAAVPTALACYATPGSPSFLKQCAQIVAQLSLPGQAQFDLTPDPAYAHALSAAIGTLQRERLALRGRMAKGATPAVLGALAATLAARFAAADAALSGIESPAAASSATSTLTSSLLRAHDAYGALAAAVQSEDAQGYQAAMAGVDGAESGVDRALEGVALLGYRQG